MLCEGLRVLIRAKVTRAMVYLKASVHKIVSAFEGLNLAIPQLFATYLFLTLESTSYSETPQALLQDVPGQFYSSKWNADEWLFSFYALDLQVQVI